MNKFFEVLAKPAKWILVIGGFVYALWFAISNAANMDGTFMSVIVNIMILVVGTALLVAVPILVLLNKVEVAKTAFLILVGYWLLTRIQGYYRQAEGLSEFNGDGLAIACSIFYFLVASCLLAVLVLTILEFALKKTAFRFISFIVLIALIGISFIAGLLYLIEAARLEWGWRIIMVPIFDDMLLPIVVCFGYLYFFGAPKQN